MSTAHEILEDQVIHVKRGRMNSLGFEPAFNSYFDYYLSTKYTASPVLKLEDVTFHLYLRKNLNDRNPKWKMPTIRQMKSGFGISQDKVEGMMSRLDNAHLLKKQSGYRAGADRKNIRNHYLLSDPIPTLDEFLTVASAGLFPYPLKEEWIPCTDFRYTGVPEIGTAPIPEIGTDQQTLKDQQMDLSPNEKIWLAVLATLKQQMPTDSFDTFMSDTAFEGVENGVAVITTTRPYAKDWLERQMANKIKKILCVELRINGEEQIQSVRCEVSCCNSLSGT